MNIIVRRDYTLCKKEYIYQEVGQETFPIEKHTKDVLIIHIKIIFAYRYFNFTLHIWHKKRKRLVVPVGDGSDESSIFMRTVSAAIIRFNQCACIQSGMTRYYKPRGGNGELIQSVSNDQDYV